MKTITKLLLAGGAVLAVKGLDNRLEITHYHIASPKLPREFDNFRIVQLSDYHNDSIPTLETEVRNESPDIIVCTGDMADDKGSFVPAVRLVSRLSPIAPVYMVSGNHELWRTDFSAFVSACEKEGAHFLRNKRVFFERGGKKIALSGLDDPYAREQGKMTRNVKRSLEILGQYEDGYEILLFHRANMLDILKNLSFDLILSGHMHGGQFRLPISKNGVCAPKSTIISGQSMFFPKYTAGLYENGGTKMIVNRGLGNPTLLPRLYNRPELSVVTLNHSMQTNIEQ
jgi:hypothetical protein